MPVCNIKPTHCHRESRCRCKAPYFNKLCSYSALPPTAIRPCPSFTISHLLYSMFFIAFLPSQLYTQLCAPSLQYDPVITFRESSTCYVNKIKSRDSISTYSMMLKLQCDVIWGGISYKIVL